MREMMARWRAAGGRINPGLLLMYDESAGYDAWLAYLDDRADVSRCGGEVPQTFYFMKDQSGVIVGAVSLRHYLNETNIVDGGHVAYGIRPEYRGRGLGHLALALALEKLREMGIASALVTCDEDNAASRRVVLRAGGLLENRMKDEDGATVERYWVGTGARPV